MPDLSEKIRLIEKKYIKTVLPDIKIGDFVSMRIKVAEADKMRVHPWEGTIIRKAGSGSNATFTVRKISFGEGVERTFPLHSPLIESIDVITRGKTKRARLYYLRDRLGKEAKIKVE